MGNTVLSAKAAECALVALEKARHDLVFLGGCTHTDRPDLPLSAESSWKSDVSETVAAIDAAISALVAPVTRNESKESPMNTGIDPKVALVRAVSSFTSAATVALDGADVAAFRDNLRRAGACMAAITALVQQEQSCEVDASLRRTATSVAEMRAGLGAAFPVEYPNETPTAPQAATDPASGRKLRPEFAAMDAGTLESMLHAETVSRTAWAIDAALKLKQAIPTQSLEDCVGEVLRVRAAATPLIRAELETRVYSR